MARKCRFHCGGEFRTDRGSTSPHGLASGLHVSGESIAAYDGVRIDDLNPAEQGGVRERGCSAPVRSGHDKQRRHAWLPRVCRSGDSAVRFPNDAVSALGPRNVGTVAAHAIERAAGQELRRRIGLDMFAPIRRPAPFDWRWYRCFVPFGHCPQRTGAERRIPWAMVIE